MKAEELFSINHKIMNLKETSNIFITLKKYQAQLNAKKLSLIQGKW